MTEEKSVGDRIEEMRAIYEQFETYGLTDRFEGVQEFKRIANEFVRYGHSASGKLPLEDIDRTLEYVLTKNPSKVSSVVLRYTGPDKKQQGRKK
jgi:hypothetical protein